MKSKKKVFGKKIANGEILNAMAPLGKLLSETFPVDVAIALVTLRKAIDKHYQIIDEIRRGLIMKYGDKAENGNRVEIIPPNSPDGKPASKNWAAFVGEMNELSGHTASIEFEKVKLPRTVSIKCKHCGRITEKPLEIEPATLLALDPFIDVEKKAPASRQGRPFGRS